MIKLRYVHMVLFFADTVVNCHLKHYLFLTNAESQVWIRANCEHNTLLSE